MSTNRLAIAATFAALTLAASAYASLPVELIKSSDLASVARRWNHGADTPIGSPTNPTPPKPYRIKAGELPAPYVAGDSLFWVEYAGQPLVKGDLFLFVYQGKLTCRPIGAVSNTSVKTVLGTEVKLSDVKGVVRRVIRVVPD